MAETPKRSVRETLGQLLVIAILIGILIGAVILARQFIDSHNTSGAPNQSRDAPSLTIQNPGNARTGFHDRVTTARQ
jgi:hypothetical protein